MILPASRPLTILVLLLTASALLLLPAAAAWPTLTVNSDPPGAACSFNGLSAASPTPFSVELVSGAYDIQCQKEGYDTYTNHITVDQDQTLDILLHPTVVNHQLMVTSAPSGAECFVDGLSIMPYFTPFTTVLNPGEHSLVCRLTGYEYYQNTFTISQDQSLDIVFTPVATTPVFHSITVSSTPTGASCYFDGFSLQPFATPFSTSITDGTHTLACTKSGYAPYQTTATVSQDQTLNVILTPLATPVVTPVVTTTPAIQITTPPGVQTTTAPAVPSRITTAPVITTSTTRSGSAQPAATAAPGTGALSVTTTPAGAQVYLDGVLIGNSPTTSSGLAPGSHTLQMKMSGYQDLSVPVSITAGQTTQYSTSLIAAAAGTPAPVATTKKLPGFGAVCGILAVAGLAGARRMLRP